MFRARAAVLVAYLIAGVVAFAVGHGIEVEHPIGVVFWADVAGTVAIFAFSLGFSNSSFYDAYWSVAPVPIALYWAIWPERPEVSPIRLAIVLALVAIWGVRLTWNWLRGWQGLGHEDWRYAQMRERSGAFYWPVSFAGIHMMPTLIVFLACLPLYPALAVGREPFGHLDIAAFVVTLGAIWLEARADKQLRRYRDSSPQREEFLRSGLWAWSRHPNYLGEMGFWWGLGLFGLAANPDWWWTLAGALAITLLFRYVSLPMIEARMRERRPGYAEWAERSSIVIPWPPRA